MTASISLTQRAKNWFNDKLTIDKDVKERKTKAFENLKTWIILSPNSCIKIKGIEIAKILINGVRNKDNEASIRQSLKSVIGELQPNITDRNIEASYKTLFIKPMNLFSEAHNTQSEQQKQLTTIVNALMEIVKERSLFMDGNKVYKTSTLDQLENIVSQNNVQNRCTNRTKKV